MKKKSIFFAKNLHMSEKSSTFAPEMKNEIILSVFNILTIRYISHKCIIFASVLGIVPSAIIKKVTIMVFDNLKQVKQFLKLWLYGKTHSSFVLNDLEIDFSDLNFKSIKDTPRYLAVRTQGTQGFHLTLEGARAELSHWSSPLCIIEISYNKEVRCFYVRSHKAVL